jgi:hypothetical protein
LIISLHFCVLSLLFGYSKGAGGHPPASPNYWVTVDITAGANPDEVVVDLSRTNGTAFAIRYVLPNPNPNPASNLLTKVGPYPYLDTTTDPLHTHERAHTYHQHHHTHTSFIRYGWTGDCCSEDQP